MLLKVVSNEKDGGVGFSLWGLFFVILTSFWFSINLLYFVSLRNTLQLLGTLLPFLLPATVFLLSPNGFAHSATGVDQVETFTLASCKSEKSVRFSTHRFLGLQAMLWLCFSSEMGALDINLSQLRPLGGVAIPARQAGNGSSLSWLAGRYGDSSEQD